MQQQTHIVPYVRTARPGMLNTLSPPPTDSPPPPSRHLCDENALFTGENLRLNPRLIDA
jgi:hypothetical protein